MIVRRSTLVVLAILLGCSAAYAEDGLVLQKRGSQHVYFVYRGRPLLSFGGISDFIFYAADDAYDYKLWSDWATKHGMNHVRAYPPLSFQHLEYFARSNGGSVKNVLFPYRETRPGSRRFDLNRFDPAYWQRFRRQCEYLHSKGIIVHLLMWNGWQLRTPESRSSPSDRYDWSGHFFNPANNVNSFTDHLGGEDANKLRIYHSVADGHKELAAAQQAWFEKLVDATAGLDNVYFDLVHELAEHHTEWPKVQRWIDSMAAAVRKRFKERNAGREAILGMDSGGLSAEARDWIFSRPYFDLLVYGKVHTVENAWRWRRRYKKPYIPQESWDDDGTKYRLVYRQDHTHIRKYMWKFMMAKCQQLDLYMKPLRSRSDDQITRYPHNYDPRGHNAFEDDAVVLRTFWDSLRDYANLKPTGRIVEAPGSHRYLLSSDKELLLYCSSATGKSGVRYPASQVVLRDVGLTGPADYVLEIIDPKAGGGVTRSRTISVQPGRDLRFELPAFTDDVAAHVYSKRLKVP